MAVAVPTAERPGSSYFAPGVRVQRLGPLQTGPQEGEDLPSDVAADIQRVEVTRVCNGASQYAITLGNWYTSTAADRRGASGDGERELRGRDEPAWPRYKYNSFDLIAFGDRLRIDLRYWPEQAAAADGAPAEWIPMIAGPVTDMRFALAAGAATVVVSGEDDLSQLKDRRLSRHEFGPMPERELATSVLSLAAYPLTSLAAPLVEWPSWATTGEGPAEAINDGQSHLEFLQKLADRLDLEVFIEFANLDDAQGGVEIHVEPARSAQPPTAQPGGVYLVERGKNLVAYTPTIKVVDQYSEVRVRGRNRDSEVTTPVDATATSEVLESELFTDPAVDRVALSPGPDVRAHFFPNRPNPLVLPNQTNLDDERGRHLALVALRRQAREFFGIEGKTIGLPRLRPGQHVEIRGMRPPFDGFFYLTRTVHSYGADGYTTAFTGRRPGMPLPPYDEA